MPRLGEGAVSTGPMVPLHDASSEGDARAVVELLEAHEIPAILNREVEGSALPWAPPHEGAARVLVPLTMLNTAAEVLHRHDYQTVPSPSGRPTRPGTTSVVIVSIGSKPPPRPAQPEPTQHHLDDELDEEDETLEEPLLPEDQTGRDRIILAAGAMVLGAAFQRVSEAILGAPRAMAELGARAPLADAPWRLVTASVMHGSATHLLSNAAFGLLIGTVLFGTHLLGATALVWLLSSVVGIGTEVALSSTPVLVIGASAGNYGLVGLWAHGQLERARASLLPSRERWRTVGILLLLAPGALTPLTSNGTKVAVAAHAAGFFAGFLLGTVFHRRLLPQAEEKIRSRSRRAGATVLVLVALAMTASLISLIP